MKVLFKKIIFFISFLTAVSADFSCTNALSGSNLKDEVSQAVERAHSESITVLTTVSKNQHGQIFPNGEQTCKMIDTIDVTFQLDPSYDFVRFIAVDRNTLKEVTDAVSFSRVVKSSNGAQFIYSTTVSFLKKYDNLLIRPVCSAKKDTTAPSLFEYEKDNGEKYDIKVLNSLKKHISYESFDSWTYENESNCSCPYHTNHTNTLDLSFFAFEEDSELDSLIVRETLLQKVDGTKLQSVSERTVELTQNEIFKDSGIYFCNVNYEFKTVQDGLVKIDVLLKDSKGNVSDSLKSFYVIKDTAIESLGDSILTFPKGFIKYDTLEEFNNNADYITVNTFTVMDSWFYGIPADELELSFYYSNDEGSTWNLIQVENGKIPLKDKNGNVVISRNKEIYIRAIAIDKAGNAIGSRYGNDLRYSDVPASFLYLTNSSAIKVYHTESDSYNVNNNLVTFYTKDINGNTGHYSSWVIETGSDTDDTTVSSLISYYEDAETYYVSYTSCEYNNEMDENSNYGIPTDFVEIDVKKLVASATKINRNLAQPDLSNTECNQILKSNGPNTGTYTLDVVINNFTNFDYVYVKIGTAYLVRFDSAEIHIDDIPYTVLNDNNYMYFYGVKSGAQKVKSIQISGLEDNVSPEVPESGKNCSFWNYTYDGEAFNFLFRIYDDREITESYECKVFYSPVNCIRTEEQIKQLPYKEVIVTDSDLQDSLYRNNHYYCDLAFETADFEPVKYQLYFYVKDEAGNYSFTEKLYDFAVTDDYLDSAYSCTPIEYYFAENTGTEFDNSFVSNTTYGIITDNKDLYNLQDVFKKTVISNYFKSEGYELSPCYYGNSHYSYIGDVSMCNVKNYKWDDKSFIVYTDQPVIVETLASKTDYGTDYQYWDRHTLSDNRINRKIIRPAVLGTGQRNGYELQTSKIESGMFYCVIMHFADGTTLLSDVKQK